MHHVRLGQGKPLLLIHGLGGTWRSWAPILDRLTPHRTIIGIDLPGFGETPPLPGIVTIETLADAVTTFLTEQNLADIDMAGSSMGARLVLELARRGAAGAVVSLDPGGFWQGWEKTYFLASIGISIKLVRALQPVMPLITGTPVGRTVLFPQFSPKPWGLPPDVTLEEMRSYANSPSFDELLRNLVDGPPQRGAPAGSLKKPLVIGWGRQDWVCLPRQAPRAQALFPDARLHWFEKCGHFPHWDQPAETARLILETTA